MTIASPLMVGEPAPDVSLFRKTGGGLELVRLQDFRGKPILVLFFPMAFTSVCTAEMCHIRDTMRYYESLDAVVIGISGDSPYALAKWAEAHQLTMILASDYNHDAARAFGVEYEVYDIGLHGVAKRSAFIIDTEGTVRNMWISDDPTVMPDFYEIEQSVKAVRRKAAAV